MKKVEYAEIACLILGAVCVVIMVICAIVFRTEVRVWHYLALAFIDCSLIILNGVSIVRQRRLRKADEWLQNVEIWLEEIPWDTDA